MKKQLVSILFALCMVLCLVPLAAFAEESTETPPECSCETACTAENMNTACPVCGAEGALPENCAKHEVSDPQPETALTALSGEGETPAASGAVTEVGNEPDLTAAIANSNVNTVKLTANIDISSSLTVNRTVTLDLNGHVLKYESANKGSVIVVENGGQLTIEDSNTSNLSHKFNPNGKLWVLDDASGTEAVTGGVITGGTGTDLSTYGGTTWYCGGGALIKNGGSLTMRGGNIIGCSAECGGGVCIDSERNGEPGQFSMSGGSIIGCVASNSGGGVFASGTFKMSGPAVIRSCTVESTIQLICGGGVYVNGSSSFEMSDTAKIEGCQAISTSAYGGGVYVSSSSSFVMTAKAEIEGCRAISNSANSSKGGGVHLSNNTKFTLSGNAVIQNCTATNSANSGEAYGGGVSAACVKEITLADSARIVGCAAANGSGLYITGSQVPGYGKLFANSGSVDGDVVLGDTEDGPSTITGSGGTVFNGKVTVTPGSTIESGIFNGEVINNGTITGGTFSGGITGKPALATGSGTVTDPYQISTAEGLKWFRDKVNNAKTPDETKICVELTEDIDLSGEEWSPIGIGQGVYWGSLSYSGTFDGKGHTIKNLSIDNSSANFVGLFGYVLGGTIRNLTVSGSVKGSGHTGGIAGGADGGTFENCANLCVVQSDSTEGGTTGGIIGFALNMDYVLIVRDCYNVGSITGRHAGGIIGQCSWHETISNCYNAGTVTGTANAGAIIGSYSSDKISNCYYLDGSVIRKGRGDKASIAKTATEFADGTVRELLKAGERDNNADPWDTTCKYLESAGMTLPVFAGQKLTAHTHVWSTYTTDTAAKTHTRSCACGVAETEACTITPATCKDGSACAVCGQQYGGPDTGKHTDLQHFPAVAATTDAEGNKEYWYCDGCKKYFSDAAATREITRADTVTAKLPQPTTPPTATPTASPTAQPTTAPQAAEQPRRTAQPTVQPTAAPTVQPVSTIPATGDTSSPILWAALLLCSGAGLALTAYKKNRHRS